MAGYSIKLDTAGVQALAGAQVELVRKLSATVERNAKLLCPVDTGRLRSSITSELDVGLVYEGGYPAVEAVGRVGTDTKYASYVELGTRKMGAQPFLRPALAAAQGDSGAQGQVTTARKAHQAAAKRAQTKLRVQRNVKASARVRAKTAKGRFLP